MYGAVSNAALLAAAGEICRGSMHRDITCGSAWEKEQQQDGRGADKGPKQKTNKCLMLVIPSHAPFQTTQLELKFDSSNNTINIENKLRKT